MNRLIIPVVMLFAFLMPAFSDITPEVIYGNDDRLDLHEVKNPKLIELAGSTVGLFKSYNVDIDEETQIAKLTTSSYGDSYDLCEDEPFRDQRSGAFCSGSLIGPSTLMTAGHCVYDTETAGYVDELIFIPAYSEDPEVTAPFGAWAASAVFTSKGYVEKGRLSQDIGAVVLDGQVQNAVGARRIAFDLKASGRSFSIYGYPEKPGPPYDGSTLIGCRSSTRDRDPGHGRPYPIAAGPCDMQDGSSGGGWITAGGFLNSVVSYGYCDSVAGLCGLTFGPFFSSQAKDIYTFPAVGGSIAPTVEIDSGPQGRSRSRQATFRFSGFGSTPVSFRCRLDRGVKFRCAKRTTLKRLKPGAHTLRVRSIDQAGRTSPRAAKRNFSVLPARR